MTLGSPSRTAAPEPVLRHATLLDRNTMQAAILPVTNRDARKNIATPTSQVIHAELAAVSYEER